MRKKMQRNNSLICDILSMRMIDIVSVHPINFTSLRNWGQRSSEV